MGPDHTPFPEEKEAGSPVIPVIISDNLVFRLTLYYL